MDYRLERLINGGAGSHPPLDALMTAVATWSVPFFAGVVVAWFAVGWVLDRPEDRRGALTALLAAGCGLLVNQAVLLAWQRPRPFAAHPSVVHTLVARSADGSFPSDHAVAAAAIAGVLVLFHRRLGAAVLAAVVLLCLARVYVGAHYPADVIAGAAIGLAVAVVLTVPLAPVGRWLVGALDRLVALVGIHPPRKAARL